MPRGEPRAPYRLCRRASLGVPSLGSRRLQRNRGHPEPPSSMEEVLSWGRVPQDAGPARALAVTRLVLDPCLASHLEQDDLRLGKKRLVLPREPRGRTVERDPAQGVFVDRSLRGCLKSSRRKDHVAFRLRPWNQLPGRIALRSGLRRVHEKRELLGDHLPRVSGVLEYTLAA